MAAGTGYSFADGDWPRLRQIIQKMSSAGLGGPTSIPTFGGISISGLTEDRVVIVGADGLLEDDSGLTYSGGSLTISSLTEDRVVIVGASGVLEDDAGLTYTGTTLSLTGAVFVGNSVTANQILPTSSTPNIGTVGLPWAVTYTQDLFGDRITIDTDTLVVDDVLHIVATGGGRIRNTSRYTTTQAIPVTDDTVYCDTDGSAWVATLPAGINGQTFRIINVGSSGNDVTIAPNGAELLTGENASRTLSDGSVIILTYETTEGWW